MDPELLALRQQRLQEMKSQGGLASSQAQAQDKGKEDQKHSLLFQILSNEARERLNRVKMVKPEKGAAVEELLINMVKTGQVLH
jgi:programmed cell death protein 5